MADILKSLRQMEEEADHKAEVFAFRHKFFAYMAMVIVVPIIVLLFLLLCALVIALPLSFFMQ